MVIGDPNPEVRYDPLETSRGGRLTVRQYKVDATAEIVKDTIKRGKTGRWEIVCDETPILGGLAVAPAPMQYFAMAVLF